MARKKATETPAANKVPRKKRGAAPAPDSKDKTILEPEVLPPAARQPERAALAVKRQEDAGALDQLEACIRRDIQLSGKLDKAGAMVAIRLGLALQWGKALLRHGEYQDWVRARFGDVFSERKAQYYSNLAAKFLESPEASTINIPAPAEMGNWLVVADDGSQLQTCVESFVGDCTIAELLDKHGVRPFKAKGGWRPAVWLVRQYQDDHAHLKGRPFETWPKADRDAFAVWQEKQAAGDNTFARRVAAESTWHGMRATLADHGMGRKTWMLIPRDHLAETRDIMAAVLRDIDKALRAKSSKGKEV